MYGFALTDVIAGVALVAGLAFVVHRLVGIGAAWFRHEGPWVGHRQQSNDEFEAPRWKRAELSSSSAVVSYSPLDRTPADMVTESYAGYGPEDIFGRSDNLHGN